LNKEERERGREIKMVARTPPEQRKIMVAPLSPTLIKETVKKVQLFIFSPPPLFCVIISIAHLIVKF